ncbi:unnamed protein product, partial [Sphacelaria rigidula]
IGGYKVECLLGDGAYGWVYRCRDSRGEECTATTSPVRRRDTTSELDPIVAIKQFKGLGDMEDEESKAYVKLTQKREAQLAMSLVHPHIVRCLGALPVEAEGKQRGEEMGAVGPGEGVGEVAFLVFEHFPGTLLELIQDRPGGLSLGEVTALLAQLLSAVDFLHQNGIAHRDVKPENVLIDYRYPEPPVLKLCDLGTARRLGEEVGPSRVTVNGNENGEDAGVRRWTEYVGSRWYRAPEMLAGSMDYSTPADVWACACLAVEMRSGRPLFPGEDEGELAINMAALLGPLPARITKRLRDQGHETPPPRGNVARSLEACLDGSTGNFEV